MKKTAIIILTLIILIFGLQLPSTAFAAQDSGSYSASDEANESGEDNPDNPDNPENPESTMGAFYDDGIDDATDKKSLKYYAKQSGKSIGTAISLYKNDLTDSSLPETEAVGFQFNMLVEQHLIDIAGRVSGGQDDRAVEPLPRGALHAGDPPLGDNEPRDTRAEVNLATTA